MTNDIIPPARQSRPMQIKNLVPSLPERGKIKIGRKGHEIVSKSGNKFQPPEKLDHFVVTTLERDRTGNFQRDERVHDALGEKPTEIPVRLLYDDPTLNFPTRYAAYKGRVLWCSGDGEEAYRVVEQPKAGEATHQKVACPCYRQNPEYEGKDKCKMNGSLSVLLEGAGGLGGVWKFRTTSYNSIVGLLSSMSFIRSVTGGPLAGIPLKLNVQPKQVTSPVDGRQQTVYVVGLTYDGDVPALQQVGHQIALDRARTHMSITHIEDEARRLLALPSPNAPLPGDDAADVVEEFYPEQVSGGDAAPARPTRGNVTMLPGQGGGELAEDVVLEVLNANEGDGTVIDGAVIDGTVVDGNAGVVADADAPIGEAAPANVEAGEDGLPRVTAALNGDAPDWPATCAGFSWAIRQVPKERLVEWWKSHSALLANLKRRAEPEFDKLFKQYEQAKTAAA